MARYADKESKPIYKKVWFWLIIIVAVILVVAMSGGNNDNSQQANSNNIQQNLKVGETWNVDGQWNLTINSVKTTSDRNEFSDKTPEQVVYVTYTYENLGYEDRNGIMNGLYFDLGPSGDTTVVDENGEMAYSYPGDTSIYPVETPVGAKCVNAQACIGLNNKSNTITMTINKYDGNGKQQKVKYTLNID